ncbi:Nitrogen regulation protein NIFR3 [Staphylococcus aureus]|nr:Nitrogen regulation protein NIFR3 [Staphylococcus aureus]
MSLEPFHVANKMHILGPQHREIGTPISTGNASWGGAPTKRISKRNSTNNASWGGPPT